MKFEPFSYEHRLVGRSPYNLKWADVLQIYRNNEESLEHWKQYYRAQGYKSWEEWREKFFKRFGLKHLAWDFMEVTTPHVVGSFRGANFSGWKKLTGQKYLRFWEMAQLKAIREYAPLRNLISNFPAETTIIAVRHNGSIFVIEGMHRCAAYALAVSEDNYIESKITMALGRKDKLFRPMFLGVRI